VHQGGRLDGVRGLVQKIAVRKAPEVVIDDLHEPGRAGTIVVGEVGDNPAGFGGQREDSR
jgi:hypothetical protein